MPSHTKKPNLSLSELVFRLAVDGELIILDANRSVAKLSPVNPPPERDSLREHRPSSVGALLRAATSRAR